MIFEHRFTNVEIGAEVGVDEKTIRRWTEDAGLYPNVAAHVKGAKISRSFKKDYLTSQQVRHVLETRT